MKKKLFSNVFAVLGLMASFLATPIGVVLAAPEWTCNSVTVSSFSNTTHIANLTLNYAANSSELVDILWGDNTAAQVIHPVGGGTYPTTANHAYGNAAGDFSITLRVWGANQPTDGFHGCGTTVGFNGCAPSGPTACKLSPMDGTFKVTGTFFYAATGGNTATVNWGDATSTPLATGTHTITPTILSHTYANGIVRTVTLVIKNSAGATLTTCTLTTTSTPSAVTLADIHAVALGDTVNWTMVAMGLLGAVVLGQLALFALNKRR